VKISRRHVCISSKPWKARANSVTHYSYNTMEMFLEISLNYHWIFPHTLQLGSVPKYIICITDQTGPPFPTSVNLEMYLSQTDNPERMIQQWLHPKWPRWVSLP